jgi:aminomethyltransferase
MSKRTPLFDIHRQLGGRMVEFGGWEMPVQYTGIMEEHLAVRNAAGLFDISHMGQVLVTGTAAESFLNGVLTNDIRKLVMGHGQYTLMCNERGGVIDDLYVYRIAATEYLLIVNASRTDADVAWLQRQIIAYPHHEFVGLHDVSAQTGAVAIQGPRVVQFIDQCFSGGSTGGAVVSRASDLKKNQIAQFQFSGHPAWIGRTGYTGEDGFEVVAPADVIATIWTLILKLGKEHGLLPAGLGARDTLRTEVCYPLYGQDLTEQITPIEAGLGFFVAFDMGDFTGRTALLGQKTNGVAKKLIAFKMTDRSAPPRPHYPIWNSGDPVAPIGEVVSGTQSPSLGIGIGLGYVRPDFAKPQMPITIEIRGQRANAVVTPKPLYRKPV